MRPADARGTVQLDGRRCTGGSRRLRPIGRCPQRRNAPPDGPVCRSTYDRPDPSEALTMMMLGMPAEADQILATGLTVDELQRFRALMDMPALSARSYRVLCTRGQKSNH